MFVSCWSLKGGSGTTVVAVALAALLGLRHPRGAVLVDLAGDAGAVAGIPDPPGPGVAEWLAAGDRVPLDGWARLEVPVPPLRLVPRGSGALPGGSRAEVLAAVLAAEGRAVVVDCGVLGGPGGAPGAPAVLAAEATVSLLVTRACYLSLRRASSAPVHPSGVVLVSEPGRSLRVADVEDVVGAPVLAEVPCDRAVAAAVDRGLLSGGLPRCLTRALAVAV